MSDLEKIQTEAEELNAILHGEPAKTFQIKIRSAMEMYVLKEDKPIFFLNDRSAYTNQHYIPFLNYDKKQLSMTTFKDLSKEIGMTGNMLTVPCYRVLGTDEERLISRTFLRQDAPINDRDEVIRDQITVNLREGYDVTTLTNLISPRRVSLSRSRSVQDINITQTSDEEGNMPF
jgi:hypothetical protein